MVSSIAFCTNVRFEYTTGC